MSGTRTQIDEFLKLKRIAVVGVSRDRNHFSRMVFRAFAERGYDVVPVNPAGGELEGRRCFAAIGEVEPAVEGALVMVPAAASAAAAAECRQAGIGKLWVYKGENADGVAGECPFMWLENAGWIHGAHKAVRGWFGGLPE